MHGLPPQETCEVFFGPSSNWMFYAHERLAAAATPPPPSPLLHPPPPPFSNPPPPHTHTHNTTTLSSITHFSSCVRPWSTPEGRDEGRPVGLEPGCRGPPSRLSGLGGPAPAAPSLHLKTAVPHSTPPGAWSSIPPPPDPYLLRPILQVDGTVTLKSAAHSDPTHRQSWASELGRS